MGAARRVWARIAAIFRKSDLEKELNEEFAAHIDLATEDYQQRGLPLAEARRLARAKFGAMEASRDEHRDSRGVPWLDGVMQDARYAMRALNHSRGFTVVAVATLALGIGVNATVFTITNAVLFKGFRGVRQNERMVYISNGGCCVPYADFEDYRARAKSFQGLAVVHGTGLLFSDGNGLTQRIDANENSAEVFRLAGAKPVLGRDFTPEDEADGARPVAILNYSFWEKRFGKDPRILGRTIRLAGAVTDVIGVMPEGFSFPQRVDVWVPLVRTQRVLERDNAATWFAFGPLANGATFESARAEINGIAARLRAAYPVNNQEFRPQVQHFHEFFIGPNAMWIYGSMWGAVGFVLLIACANLANLLLSRALTRAREISVRVALGAGRWRVVRQLLIESLMLSTLGGVFGWWIAKWGVSAYDMAVSRRSPWLIVDYRMEWGVLVYLIGISVATGILFGLVPALRLSKLDIHTTLKDGGRGAAGAGRNRRLSSMLVAGEMALAMMLLAGAGVMVRSFLKVYTADLGVKTENIIGANVQTPPVRFASPEQRIAFFDRLGAQLKALPGVGAVMMADGLPSWDVGRSPYEVAGIPPDPKNRQLVVGLRTSPDYFRTFGARLLEGRDFTDADGLSSTPVAIVNERFARKQWPGEDPIGKRVRLFDGPKARPWMTVVGVVSNIIQNDSTRQQFHPVVYRPYRQDPGMGMWVMLRTVGPPASVMSAFRNELVETGRDLPVYGPVAIADRIENFWASGFYGIIYLTFAAIALLLAAVGLYTVIAHSVDQRTQEIGIRMAIGASARGVLNLIVREGMLPLLGGLAAGLVASIAVNRLLQSELVNVSPTDPAALAVAASVLIASAFLGCLVPALRAMRVDPVVALRHD